MGKHPTVMDYFQLGSSAPLVNAFAVWAENGYQKLVAKNRKRTAFCSWRFWAKGMRKGYIACGLGRDSSDSAGRPYPLMIMGIGTLAGWEENWDLLHHFRTFCGFNATGNRYRAGQTTIPGLVGICRKALKKRQKR
jgi:type VI secretion system protein VasJ